MPSGAQAPAGVTFRGFVFWACFFASPPVHQDLFWTIAMRTYDKLIATIPARRSVACVRPCFGQHPRLLARQSFSR